MSPNPSPAAGSETRLFYVGTYCEGNQAGIHQCWVNLRTGALEYVKGYQAGPNPSFLALHPSGRYLYAVNELSLSGEKPGGAVGAYAVEPGTGDLSLLNQEPSHGAHPCHLVTDRTGRWVLVANYSSGTFAVYPIARDGGLKPACQVVRHQGSGPHAKRQAGPHAHAVYTDPGNTFALTCDLGIDRVVIYRLDLEQGQLTAHGEGVLAGGAGPRHLDFSPDGRFVYVINELDGTVTVFIWDSGRGTLDPVQTVSTLPAGFTGRNLCAEIAVHPTGKFVYGSNRGHHSIVIYAADSNHGRLTLAGHVTEGINEPRSFAIAPGGTLLVAANQHSDSVIPFAVDPGSGALRQCGEGITVPKPVCVLFA